MAIGDAAALGAAISSHAEDVEAALSAYDAERVPTTTQEVSHSCRGELLCAACLPAATSASMSAAAPAALE